MTTISANRAYGIELTASYTNPIAIGMGVNITNPGYPSAIYTKPNLTLPFVIDNNGSVSGSRYGVTLSSGGTVTNSAVGLIAGTATPGGGLYIGGGIGTVINDGRIVAQRYAVDLEGGGFVTNGVAGYIGSAYPSVGGIRIAGNVGTIVNAGTIGLGRVGIRLVGGGSVINETGGLITGGGAVNIYSGTILNDGVIRGMPSPSDPGVGVGMMAGGSVTNGVNGTISAYYWGVEATAGDIIKNDGSIISSHSFGVYLPNGGTIVNGGTISGAGTAVNFGGTAGSLLVLEPGFAFSGQVVSSSSASNTLELSSSTQPGTVSGVGTTFAHFGTINLDAGAHWTIVGVSRGLAGPINGFAGGDTVEVLGVTATGSSYSGGVLTLAEGAGSTTLDLPGSFTTRDFVVTNVPAGVDVSVVACFAEGTLIAGLQGEVRVEDLVIGAVVRTQGGLIAPVVWIGHRRIDCHRHPRPRDVWPVRIATGAFGSDLPHRDLWLSPDHAIYVDNVLIPIRYLINGATIVQEAVDEVTYYHLELEKHAVISAEGLPCESYLDTGNRSAFSNGGSVAQMHPEFALGVWAANACAPLVLAGPKLASVRYKLRHEAAALGHTRSRDPELHIEAAGILVFPRLVVEGMSRFALPYDVDVLKVVSRTGIPAEIGPTENDRRLLGVMVKAIILRRPGWRQEIKLEDIPEDHGFYPLERAGAKQWRWTDGRAGLRIPTEVRGNDELLLDIHILDAQESWVHIDPTKSTGTMNGKKSRRALGV